MLKISALARLCLAVIVTMSLGSVNASAIGMDEEAKLIEEVIAGETSAEQKGSVDHVEMSQPSEAKLTDEGVTGNTEFGEISVSFSGNVNLEDNVLKEYAVDAEAGAVARASSEVGTLLWKTNVEDHEQFVEAKWELSLPNGVEAVAFADGSIGFRIATSQGVSILSETTISAPWAVDEYGNTLETWYEISPDGTYITQIVNTQDVEGEIILDPRVTFGWGVYYNWYGGELRLLKSAGATSFALALGYGCLQAGKLRHPALIAVVGLLCLTTASTTALRSLRYALDNLKNINDDTCYQWKVGSDTIHTVGAKGNCSV